MKVIELCGSGHCPVVKIEDDRVVIGKKDNLYVLPKLGVKRSKRRCLVRKFKVTIYQADGNVPLSRQLDAYRNQLR